LRLDQRNDHPLTAEVFNRCVDGLVDGKVGEGLMREVMRLQIVPDDLDVIQFGRVFGRPLDGEPMCASGEGCERELADVDRPIVLDKHNGLAGRPGMGP